jgi:hemolysin D
VLAGSHLKVEAMVSNRDIGFAQVGQEAEIKVDTFNLTRYGPLHGRALSVSQDAIARQAARPVGRHDTVKAPLRRLV